MTPNITSLTYHRDQIHDIYFGQTEKVYVYSFRMHLFSIAWSEVFGNTYVVWLQGVRCEMLCEVNILRDIPVLNYLYGNNMLTDMVKLDGWVDLTFVLLIGRM
jgi:hypothetical protein